MTWLFVKYRISRGGEVVSRKAHNLEIVGSNPAPATWFDKYIYVGVAQSVRAWDS